MALNPVLIIQKQITLPDKGFELGLRGGGACQHSALWALPVNHHKLCSLYNSNKCFSDPTFQSKQFSYILFIIHVHEIRILLVFLLNSINHCKCGYSTEHNKSC